MSGMDIFVTRAMTAPAYGKMAAGLLEACRKAWTPEMEAEYQKAKKGGPKGEHVLGGGDRVSDRERSRNRRNGDPERVAG